MIGARLRVLWGLVASREAEVDGHRLRLEPGVLDPTLFRTGAWFARKVAEQVRPGERLLDLGCGSGVVGVLAARRGARVCAVDLDPRAVRSARANGIEDARCGDLFQPVSGERFDRICFNPPYFSGSSTGRAYGRALYGGPGLALVRRFAAEAPNTLLPGGLAMVAWSDRAPPAGPALGTGWTLQQETALPDERLEIWILQR